MSLSRRFFLKFFLTSVGVGLAGGVSLATKPLRKAKDSSTQLCELNVTTIFPADKSWEDFKKDKVQWLNSTHDDLIGKWVSEGRILGRTSTRGDSTLKMKILFRSKEDLEYYYSSIESNNLISPKVREKMGYKSIVEIREISYWSQKRILASYT